MQQFTSRSRHVDSAAVSSIVNSLRERQFAIVHVEDLLGADDELWTATVAFMQAFANSEAARRHEATYRRHLQDNLDLDEREQTNLAALSETLTKAKADLVERQSRLAAARAGKDSKLVTTAKKAAHDARLALKEASVRAYTAQKSFQLERKRLNRVFKPFIFTGNEYLGRRLAYADPPVLVSAHPVLLEIARRYYGEDAKIRIPTIWRVAPIPQGMQQPDRKGSQLWHRDQTDYTILKLFMYFSDVDEGSGALEYIPNSGPRASKWSTDIPLLTTTGYPPPGLVEERVPASDMVRCIGRKGSFVFVDTAGLHRGGYAVSGPRITNQATYLRQNPKFPQSPLIVAGQETSELTSEQVFAFS